MSDKNDTTAMEAMMAQQGETAIAPLDLNSGAMSFFEEMAADAAADEANTALLSELDIRDLLPIMRIPREGNEYTVTVGKGGESIPGLKGVKYVTVMPVAIVGQRALWPTDKDAKVPVCATGLQQVDKLNNNSVISRWAEEGDVPRGRECRGCKWNEFDTIGEWDPSKADSRAKACSESRLMFLAPVQKLGPIANMDDKNWYDVDPLLSDPGINPFGLILFNLSYGSNVKAIQQMVKECKVRKIALWASVWRIGVERKKTGSFDVGYISVTLCGSVSPKGMVLIEGKEHRVEMGYQGVRDHVIPWIEDYIDTYGRAYSQEAISHGDEGTKEGGSDNGGWEEQY